MQRSVSYMIEHDLLVSYREISGIGRALNGIQRRLKRESRLSDGVGDLRDHYADLGADFEAFFPQLIEFAKG